MAEGRPINYTVPLLVSISYILLGVFLLAILGGVFSTDLLYKKLSTVYHSLIWIVVGVFAVGGWYGCNQYNRIAGIGHSLDPAENDHTSSASENSTTTILCVYFVVMNVVSCYIYSYWVVPLITLLLLVFSVYTVRTHSWWFVHLIDKYWDSKVSFMMIGLSSSFLFGITGGFLNWDILSGYSWVIKVLEEEFWLRWEISAIVLHVIVVGAFFKEFYESREEFSGIRSQTEEMQDWLKTTVIPTFLSSVLLITSGIFFCGYITNHMSIGEVHFFGSFYKVSSNQLNPHYILYAFTITLSILFLIFADWATSYYVADYSYEHSLRDMILFGDMPLMVGTVFLLITYFSAIPQSNLESVNRSAFFGGGIAFQLTLIHTAFIVSSIREINGSYNINRRTYFTCNKKCCGNISCDSCTGNKCPESTDHVVVKDKSVWVVDTEDDFWV